MPPPRYGFISYWDDTDDRYTANEVTRLIEGVVPNQRMYFDATYNSRRKRVIRCITIIIANLLTRDDCNPNQLGNTNILDNPVPPHIPSALHYFNILKNNLVAGDSIGGQIQTLIIELCKEMKKNLKIKKY